tara:strand:- start:1237 stop:1854 length:618 start_codon:yes stop_codon:yes gene_type:complete
METLKMSRVKPNPDNPRLIKDDKYKKLIASITQSPSFMILRPVILDETLMILGGNMRYKACKELKWTDIPIKIFTQKQADENNKRRKAEGLEEATYIEQCREFIIKDNIGFGEHAWDLIASQWDSELLNEWAMDVWQPEEEVDYSALEDLDLDETIEDKEAGVKRAIMIEFDPKHYDQANELITQARKDGKNVGLIVLNAFKDEL